MAWQTRPWIGISRKTRRGRLLQSVKIMDVFCDPSASVRSLNSEPSSNLVCRTHRLRLRPSPPPLPPPPRPLDRASFLRSRQPGARLATEISVSIRCEDGTTGRPIRFDCTRNVCVTLAGVYEFGEKIQCTNNVVDSLEVILLIIFFANHFVNQLSAFRVD